MLFAATHFSRWHRMLMALGVGMCIVRCSFPSIPAPRLNLSDEKHMLMSIEQMEDVLPLDKRTVFELSLQRLFTRLTLQDINHWKNSPTSIPALSLLHLNGLTAEEIIAKAEAVEL